MWGHVLEHFLLSPALLIPFCKEEMLGKKAGNWNLLSMKWLNGHPRSPVWSSHLFTTKKRWGVFPDFLSSKESLQTNINDVPYATFSMKFK